MSGEARLSATIFINLTGMLSGPQEQSDRSFLSLRRTCPRDTGLRAKALCPSSGREFISLRMLSCDVAVAPVTRWAVEAKFAFSLSGLNRSG